MNFVSDAVNLAPEHGELYLNRGYYCSEKADLLFQKLSEQLRWRQEKIFLFGRWVEVPRLMCWYGDSDAHYRYSGTDHAPIAWNDTLLSIKAEIEKYSGTMFNSVMANLYRNGQDSMGCHSDDEKELGKNPLVASLSFGESRLLRFRHKRNEKKVEIELRHGDLLLMAGELQHHWRHELPKSKKVQKARINLTFRKIYPQLK